MPSSIRTPPEALYRTGQAAVMLQVSPATIYRWVLSGEIEHLRFPGKQGHHRITRSALERFAAAHGIPMLEPGNGNGAQLKPPKTKKAKKQIRPAA